MFDPDLGQTINKVVQHGSDSGIKRHVVITQDMILGGAPLKTNRSYYYFVTAYGYNEYGIQNSRKRKCDLYGTATVPNTWSSDESTAVYGTR